MMFGYYCESSLLHRIRLILDTISDFISPHSPHRELDSRSGIHSHITLAAKKGACQISSYLNPEAFSQHF